MSRNCGLGYNTAKLIMVTSTMLARSNELMKKQYPQVFGFNQLGLI